MMDTAYIKGQEHVKRALEVAAAGGHSVRLVGSPGSGKSMFAQTFVQLLPDLNDVEANSVLEACATAGIPEPSTLPKRQLVAPCQWTPRDQIPKLLQLAQHGVLLLDNAPELGATIGSIASALHSLESGALCLEPLALGSTTLVITQ